MRATGQGSHSIIAFDLHQAGASRRAYFRHLHSSPIPEADATWSGSRFSSAPRCFSVRAGRRSDLHARSTGLRYSTSPLRLSRQGRRLKQEIAGGELAATLPRLFRTRRCRVKEIARDLEAQTPVALPLRLAEILVGGGLLGKGRMPPVVLRDVRGLVSRQGGLDVDEMRHALGLVLIHDPREGGVGQREPLKIDHVQLEAGATRLAPREGAGPLAAPELLE